jgi:hypothetical protein
MHSDHNEAAAAFSITARLSNFLPFPPQRAHLPQERFSADNHSRTSFAAVHESAIRTVGFHVHFWHY